MMPKMLAMNDDYGQRGSDESHEREDHPDDVEQHRDNHVAR